MNILTAAGIAQINEPIFPQNGERIWGGLGVVTFNQASQYNEEENPDSPITPPNCTNCGGGIPPEVPQEPTLIQECLSDCSIFNNDFFIVTVYRIIDGAISSSAGDRYNYKHYNEAFDAMLDFVQTDEYRAAMEESINRLVNQYTFDNSRASSEITDINSFRSRLGNLYYKECYDILKYSDGHSESIVSGYDYTTTPKSVYNVYSAILTRKYTNKSSGRVTTSQIEYKIAQINFWGNSNYRCAICYARTSGCYNF